MEDIKLSIIIPVYNAEKTLDRCISSILDQEFDAYEVILVDDGSSDSSSAICDGYAGSDARFFVKHQANSGVSASRNAGLDMARGDYVMFVDSDDALIPYALDDMFKCMNSEDMVVGGYAVFRGGVPSHEVCPLKTMSYSGDGCGQFLEDNIRRNCMMLDSCWAKLFKRDFIGDLRFDVSLSYAEDKLFVFELLSRAGSVMAFSSPVYSYYIAAGTLGSDRASDRHLSQLRSFLPKYASLIETLRSEYPASARVQNLYHEDLVGRYLCRILNLFILRRSYMLTKEYLEWVYEMMDADDSLGIFSIRLGQVLNIVLYKIRKPAMSMRVYSIVYHIHKIFTVR